jgi:predicted RNA-binding Zn-ribbon protein involved in translation (DUF1610 family)
MNMVISCPECGKRMIARSLKQAYKLLRSGLCERCQQEQQSW